MENSAQVVPPADTRGSRRSQLTLFAGKALIVAVLFIVSFLVIAVHVESKISQAAADIRSIKIGGPDFWKKVENEIDRAADPKQGLPPEKRRQILTKLHALSVQWKPFIDEAYSALTDNQSEPPTSRK